MEDKVIPQPAGGSPLPPPSLSPDQDDLCRRLDELHNQYGLKVKPSEMFRGAVFATREWRSNPDWIAQAANSLREILYPFWSSQVKAVSDKKEKALKKYGSVFVDELFMQEVGRVYGQLNDLAHHGSNSNKLNFANFRVSDFERLLVDFVRVMRAALMRQTDLHKEIDQILSGDPARVILDNLTA